MTTNIRPTTQSVAVQAPQTVAIPVGKVTPWAAFAAVLLACTTWFVSSEQGAAAVFGGDAIHEYVHDARHLLGFPCH